MTILQRWIIAVRGRSDCGILLGGQRLVGVCGDGGGDRSHHHQRRLIPVSREPETAMQAAQLLQNRLLPLSPSDSASVRDTHRKAFNLSGSRRVTCIPEVTSNW
jgi:hypothetical protein